MQKFEYIIEQIESTTRPLKIQETTASLNTLGIEGWELVAIVPIEEFHGKESLFYFKRPLK